MSKKSFKEQLCIAAEQLEVLAPEQERERMMEAWEGELTEAVKNIACATLAEEKAISRGRKLKEDGEVRLQKLLMAAKYDWHKIQVSKLGTYKKMEAFQLEMNKSLRELKKVIDEQSELLESTQIVDAFKINRASPTHPLVMELKELRRAYSRSIENAVTLIHSRCDEARIEAEAEGAIAAQKLEDSAWAQGRKQL